MNPAEYDRMYALENHYWWFVARRQLALRLISDCGLRIADSGAPDSPAKPQSRNGMRSPEADQCELLSDKVSDNPKSEIRNPKSPRILDFGCGTGAVLEELAHIGKYVGLDMSGQALEYCRQRGLSTLARGRGEVLPFSENSFDAIVALDVFEHIEDDQAAMQESFRALKPGGVLVLSVPAFKMLWGPHDVALMHFRRYRRGELRERLESAGFRIEKLSYSVFFLFPLVVLFRFFEKRKRGDAHASLPNVPGWLNRALIGLQSVEAWLIGKVSLPWGSSLVAVARKVGDR